MLYLGRLVQGFEAQGAVLGAQFELPGPVGEKNLYVLHPRGRILAIPSTRHGLRKQIEAIAATGNSALVPIEAIKLAETLTREERNLIEWADDWRQVPPFPHVLIEKSDTDIRPILADIAAKDGPIPIVQTSDDQGQYRRDWMLEEVSTSFDTTAAGGNASLMALV